VCVHIFHSDQLTIWQRPRFI